MIGFIILHYQNYKVTEECIAYLLRLKGILDHEIIIVDNGSPNGSGEILKNEYKKNHNIHIVLCEENLGFSRGNNVGYKYSKNTLHTDCMVVMNSDVFIKDELFIDKTMNVIKNNGNIEIIAPDVIDPEGCHGNPYRYETWSDQYVKKSWIKNTIYYYIYSTPCIGKLFHGIRIFVQKKSHKVEQTTEKDKYNKLREATYMQEAEDFIPAGCCILYTNRWIEKEKICFVPITFMMHEEYILYEYCKYRKYNIKYIPSLLVYHADGATRGDAQRNMESLKRIFKWYGQASHALLKFRKQLRSGKDYVI